MTQINAKIRDVLKTEYADFVAFCISLDKQFIYELTTSDFIAFRTKHGVARDYVANIRHALDSYDPDAEPQLEEAQVDSTTEASIATDAMDENKAIIPDKAEHEGKSNATVLDESKTVADDAPIDDEEQPENSKQTVVLEDNSSIPIIKPKYHFSSEKLWLKSAEGICTLDLERPIYDLFGIPHNSIFSSRDIIELGLSVRPYNCLRNSRCKTWDALFSKTILQIAGFSNLGKKSLIEIIEKCKEIASSIQEIAQEGLSSDTDTQVKVMAEPNKKLAAVAESIVLGIEYDVSDLNEGEKNYAHTLEEAYQVIGEELCLLALEEPEKAKNLCATLNDYIERQETLEQILQFVTPLPQLGISMELHVLPFVAAMKKKTQIDLNTVFTDNDRFSDFSTVVENYLENNPQHQTALTDSIHIFIDDTSIGVKKLLEKASENAITTDRVPVVIKLRSEGHTLAEVGDLLDITRERVRQIEQKALRRFSGSLKHSGKDVIGYIHALLDGDLMIHKEEIASCISNGSQIDLLWACIKDGTFDCKRYYYSPNDHAVVFKHGNISLAESIVDALPEYIFKDELETIVQQAIEEKGVWEEKIRADIKHRYKVFGTLYSERRPTLIFICDWVLKNRFVNGFKVNDETDAKRFLAYIREVFGEESSHMTPRALDAKVSQIGVLCDRGKYIHPSTVSIDLRILEEVDQYIADSPKSALSFIELFEAFKDKFVGTQISNHYFLQGVMKVFGNNEKKPCPYYVYRDYITKDPNVSTTDELDTFVRERGLVHKSEIFAEFPALSEATLGQVVARCPNVFNIDGGNYVHASQFHIQEEDYTPLRTYLKEVTRELPVNIRKVFEDCSVKFPWFIDRNELHNRDLLFAALNYMFRDEFRFTKPYIASNDDVELTNRGVILSILEPFDEIEIDELMDLLDDRGVHYVSLSNLLQLIAPDYIRVDENMLMKRGLTGIDDDVVEETLTVLRDAIEVNGYLPSCAVQDFIWYPSIDVAWTPYLLEAIVLSSDEIDYIPYPFSRSQRTLIVYVGKKFAHSDFQSLLLDIIANEYDKGTFTRKSDMREWLIEEGFIDVKLPNYLESSQYYYMGADGRLVKREEAEQ